MALVGDGANSSSREVPTNCGDDGGSGDAGDEGGGDGGGSVGGGSGSGSGARCSSFRCGVRVESLWLQRGGGVITEVVLFAF